MERLYSSCAIDQSDVEQYSIYYHSIPSSDPRFSDLKRDHRDIPNDTK